MTVGTCLVHPYPTYSGILFCSDAHTQRFEHPLLIVDKSTIDNLNGDQLVELCQELQKEGVMEYKYASISRGTSNNTGRATEIN